MRGAWLALGILWAAAAAAEALYRLPWADGGSFMFTQVPVGISMPVGVRVVAARDGLVEAVEQDHGASAEDEPLTYEGNFVRVRHADGTAATYAHLAHRGVAVAAGHAVKAGDLLGYRMARGDFGARHVLRRGAAGSLCAPAGGAGHGKLFRRR